MRLTIPTTLQAAKEELMAAIHEHARAEVIVDELRFRENVPEDERKAYSHARFLAEKDEWDTREDVRTALRHVYEQVRAEYTTNNLQEILRKERDND